MYWNKNNKFNLLSISGGSQRGVVSLAIALKLENALKKINPNKEFIEYFDAITAVSSGSLLASCLVLPSEKNSKKPKYSLSYCYKFYNEGSINLNKSLTIWNIFLVFTGLKESVLSTDRFEKKVIKNSSIDIDLTNNLRLKDTVIPINIVSYDVDNDRPRIWSTYTAKNDAKKNYLLKDAFLASISVPPILTKKNTTSKFGENMNDYDGALINMSPLWASLELISQENKLVNNDLFIVSIGTSILKVKDILQGFDNQNLISKAIDYVTIAQQIQKPTMDRFLKYQYKNFYKLDLVIPSKISKSFYNFNDEKDLDNYKKLISCTLKYLEKNEGLLIALSKKIAGVKQDTKKLEKMYSESDFYCENPEKVLVEYQDKLDELKTDL